MKAALFFVSTLLLVSSACSPQASAPPASSPTPQANANLKRSLGSFQCIPGTNYRIMPITSSGEGKGFSSGYTTYVHNYVFLDTATLSSTKLLPTNNFIISATQLTTTTIDHYQNSSTQPGCTAASQPVQWIFYTVTKEDTNGDRVLSNEDLSTIAITTADGRNYTELIPKVQNIYGLAMHQSDQKAQQLVVVYRQIGKNQVSVIDLAQKSVTLTQPLTDLGADVN